MEESNPEGHELPAKVGFPLPGEIGTCRDVRGIFMGEILGCVCNVVNNKISPDGRLNILVFAIIELVFVLDEFRSIVKNPLLRPIELQEFVARCNGIG